MITTAFLTKEEIMSIVPEFIEDVFNIDSERVNEQLKPMVDILVDDMTFFIEYPYVDKFYRDSYYSFFSKKHNYNNRNSVRISFFDISLESENYFDTKQEELDKLFLGYISLRPTTYRIIGHSFVSPKALKNNGFVCCLSRKQALVNGRKISTHGFPYCSQDNESITCSEAVIINLIDYFSHKYPEYSTILPSQVVRILSKQSYQRQLPAHGLPTENISYVLKKLGFGTVVYSSDKKSKEPDIYESDDFKDLLYTYIESGIPVIATLSTKDNTSNHAVLVIGRLSLLDETAIKNKSRLPNGNKSFEFSKAFRKLLIMNDNRPPYDIVDYYQPIKDEATQSFYQFKSFIVPLYSKVHLDAYQFKQFFFLIIDNFENDPETCFVKFTEPGKDYTYRFFLTSSRSYKNYIATSKDLSNDFKSITINKSMPKFVWVGEIIAGNNVKIKQQVHSIVVVDATESGLTGHLIFATNSKHLIIRNSEYFLSENEQDSHDKKYQILEFEKEIFYTFENNLKGEHTKWQN